MYRHVIEIVGIVITALCVIHCYLAANKRLDIPVVFFTGAAFIGGVIEVVAIVTTDTYSYPGFWLYIGPLPIFIAVSWGSTFYFVYQLANRLLQRWEGKPLFILWYGLLAGILGVVLDLWFDPVAVVLKWWEWKGGSAYYGVPIVNFAGWFFLCTGFCAAFKFLTFKTWSFPKKLGLFYLMLIGVLAVTAGATVLPFWKS